MTIHVLVCHPDGFQEMVEREVPDDYFDQPEPAPLTKDELPFE